MGFESFRVELRGGQRTFDEADEVVRTLPNIKPDHHSLATRGSKHYLVADGQHVIELELMDSPVRLSCRFTLCHPSSVDSAFLALLKELMGRLEMTVKICDDVPPEHSRSFSLNEFAVFSAISLGCIAPRREEWRTTFGNETLAATTNEAHERIILPRCQPGVVQPT